jgi:hypothetical protein
MPLSGHKLVTTVTFSGVIDFEEEIRLGFPRLAGPLCACGEFAQVFYGCAVRFRRIRQWFVYGHLFDGVARIFEIGGGDALLFGGLAEFRRQFGDLFGVSLKDVRKVGGPALQECGLK